MLVQLFAREHADEVAGMMITNAVPPCDPWMDQGLKHMTPSEQVDERSYYAGCERRANRLLRMEPRIDAAPLQPASP